MPSDIAHQIEQTLLDAESQLGVFITIHDLKRVFVDQQRDSLLSPHRRRHTNPVCEIVHDTRCIDHCMIQINQQASKTDRPFTHCCWKQVIEITVGLYEGKEHVATLFAGAFKPVKITDAIDPRWQKEYQVLKLAEPQKLEPYSRLLQAIGQGLLSQVRRTISREEPSDRKSIIHRWIKEHCADESSLEDLASALYLSVSRTSHLVRQLFETSFRQLIRDQRLERARHLLLTTDQNTETIANAIGMQSPYHFNRAFKQVYGIPPGRFRKQSRNQA